MQGFPEASGAAETASKGQDSKDPLLHGLLLEGEEPTRDFIQDPSEDPSAARREGTDMPVEDVAVAVPMPHTSSQQTRAGSEVLPTVVREEGGEDQADQVARLKYLLYAAASCIVVLLVVIVAIIVVTTTPLFNAPTATEDGGLAGGGACVSWGGAARGHCQRR